jgi:hypothetical protein
MSDTTAETMGRVDSIARRNGLHREHHMSEQPNGSPGTAGQAFATKVEVSFHDHFTSELVAQQRYVESQFLLRDKANDLAYLNLKGELERLNELRQIVNTLLATRPSNTELIAMKEALEARISSSNTELSARTVSQESFRVAHESTAKSADVLVQLSDLWERVDKELQPLKDAKIIAASKADQWKANLGLVALALSLLKFGMDYLVGK